jgi:hypothetical protein
MAGSSSIKRGSGVYNLATAYNAGGANNITESIARKSRIDLLGFINYPLVVDEFNPKCLLMHL